jgi:polar amino acid transport system substrate-binding protein
MFNMFKVGAFVRFISSVLLTVFISASCAWAGDRLDNIVKRGEMVVAVGDFENKPFFFVEEGDLVGFDVDLGRMIAEEIGVDVRFVRVPWDGLIALAWYSRYPWSRYDMAIASITIRQSRARACDFSDWYFYTGQKLLVREGDGYETPLDLEGKTIAVMAGSTGYETAKRDLAAQTVVMDSPQETVDALRAGSVDGALSDATIVIAAADKYDGLVALEGMVTTERYGVVLPKGEEALRKVVDSVVVEARRILYDKWFR